MRMRIVVVQSRPYQAFAGGDGAYVSALVRHLGETGNDVIGITSGSTKGRPRALLRLAYPLPRGGQWHFRSTIRLGETYVALGAQLVRDALTFLRQRRDPPKVSPFMTPPDASEQRWIERTLRRLRPDLVILTFETACAIEMVERLDVPYLSLVGFLPIRSYVLNGDAAADPEQKAAAANFVNAIRRADAVGFNSRDDCNFARAELGIAAPVYVGMGFVQQAERTTGESRVLLFVGNKTEPNREAVGWFLEQVWPRIRSAVPDARFRIVGRVGTYFDSDPAAGIECAGEVPALAAEYCGARAVVAPLLTGSAGVKTKVAEAISYGCPLIATSLGVDGGDTGQIDAAGFVADSAEDFAERTIALLVDDDLWREKQAGTARVFDQLFSREAAYREIDALILATRERQSREQVVI